MQNISKAELNVAQPLVPDRRIGGAVYTVSVRFSETSNETLEDKLFRLIEREVISDDK